MSTLFVSKRLSIAPGARFSGDWQDISAWENGLVKAKLELLEKEFDRPWSPWTKPNKTLPNDYPTHPGHYQASFGHYQDILATATSKRTLPQSMSLDGFNRVQ